MTTSARSTSSRSTSSFRTRVRSRSKGPWKTSRSRSSVATRTRGRLARGPDAQTVADVGEGLGGDRAGAVRALAQNPQQLALVAAQLVIALAYRGEVVDDRVGHRSLERAVALAVELLLDRFRGARLDHGQDLDQVGHAGLVGRAAHFRPG